MQIFEARHLSLSYGTHEILREVNLSISTGEFWFFLGPNGEGKSTFLKALLGELRPASGELVTALEREKLGFVPQSCGVSASLPTTVREFVLLGLVGISGGKEDRSARLTWALKQVGLTELEMKNYWSLSGGQRQRALVARALVRRPHLLIADEPTNGLDVTAEGNLLACLKRLNEEENLSVIFVTHQLSLASRYATHVAIFHGGGIQSGRRTDVLNDQNLSTARLML